MANKLVLKFAHRTHPGKARSENQDFVLLDGDLRLFVLCDGAGGHRGGRMAAELAARRTVEEVKKAVPRMAPELSRTARWEACEDIVREAMRTASQAVADESQELGIEGGSYSTLDLLWFVDEATVIIGHIGDGGVFRHHQNSSAPLTVDHNIGTDLNQSKADGETRYTREQIRRSRELKTISRAMGLVSSKPDVSLRSLSEWEYFLICSDGLLEELSHEEVLRIAASAPDLEKAATDILGRALAGSARDNISFWLVGCQPVLSMEERSRTFSPGHLSDTFRALQLFQGLRQHEMEALIGRGRRVILSDGEFLLMQGDPANSLWVVLDGSVKVFLDGVKVNENSGPTVIGEGAFSSQARVRNATIQASGTVKALKIEREDLMRFARDHQQAALQITMRIILILLDRTEKLSKRILGSEAVIKGIGAALEKIDDL